MTENGRIAVANEVLGQFAPGTEVVRRTRERGRIIVIWEAGGHLYRREWLCRGQDFFPVWSKRWPHGGTACTALSQLVRWVRDRPVLPLAVRREVVDGA